MDLDDLVELLEYPYLWRKGSFKTRLSDRIQRVLDRLGDDKDDDDSPGWWETRYNDERPAWWRR